VGVLNDEGAMISVHNTTDWANPMLDSVGYGQSGTAPDPLNGESTARYWNSGASIYTLEWSRNGIAGPTPGAANNALMVNSTPEVVLNEVKFFPAQPQYGFIELMYTGTRSIDISNFKIVCDSEYTVPGGTFLNSNDPYYYLIQAGYPIGFDLDDGVTNGDNVYLYDDNGNLHDMVGWSTSHINNMTVTRVPNGFGTYQGFSDTTSEAAGWVFNQMATVKLVTIGPKDLFAYGNMSEILWFYLTIENKMTVGDNINVMNQSMPLPETWIIEIFLDDKVTKMTDTTGDGIPDIWVGQSAQVSFWVKVIIPDVYPPGYFNNVTISATSNQYPYIGDSAILQARIYPYVYGDKSISPSTVNIEGTGYGEEAWLTLSLTGMGFPSMEYQPQDVIFLIDSSGSMGPGWWGPGNDPTFERCKASKNYVDRLRPPDRAAVIDFDDDAWLVPWGWPTGDHLSTNYPQVKMNIDSVDNAGGTNIHDAIVVANWEFIGDGVNPGYGNPDHIWVEILLTDGEDSFYSDAQILAQADVAAANGIIIFTIGLGPSHASNLLQQIADRTGGTYYPAADASYLDEIYESISSTLGDLAGWDIDITDSSPMIRDILPPWINYNASSFTFPPDIIKPGAGGTTILEWNVTTIRIGEKWEIAFQITTSNLGTWHANEFITSRIEYTNWANETVLTPFPETFITGVVGEPSPPELSIDVLPGGTGNDVRLSWVPPPEPGISHYLIYKSEEQNNFDFNDIWRDTSIHIDPVDGFDPLRRTWNYPGAVAPGQPTEMYYCVRAVNGLGEISDTSRTVGTWTTTFPALTSTFSLPLQPTTQRDTDYYTTDMNANYIRYLDSVTRNWVQHDNGMGGTNNIPMEVGEGFEVNFGTTTRYTFTGMPGAMVRYDNTSFGFDAAPDGAGEADKVTVTVDTVSETVTLYWSLPVSIIPGLHQYQVLRSPTRDGFWGLPGIDYTLLATLPFDITQYSDVANATQGTRWYYMIMPLDPVRFERGSGTYTVGVWTGDYDAGYDTFAIPLKIDSTESVDWYCDAIDDIWGMNYYNTAEQRWIWHKTVMPSGIYDEDVEMGRGYQISTSVATKYSFIGI
jgi:hypothetical protein